MRVSQPLGGISGEVPIDCELVRARTLKCHDWGSEGEVRAGTLLRGRSKARRIQSQEKACSGFSHNEPENRQDEAERNSKIA